VEFLATLTIQQWAAVLSIGISLPIFLRPVRRWIAKMWQNTFGRTRRILEQHIEDEGRQLEEILKEFKPNDGSSLRDVIDKISERQHGFEAFLTAQLNTIEAAIFRTDANGKVTYINRHHQRLTGFSFNEVEGDGWINVIHPAERKRVFDSWQRAVVAEREFSEDIKYITADGENEYMVHVNVYRELDSNNVLRGYLGVVTLLGE
jgi:PAS domain S-box-containing protein